MKIAPLMIGLLLFATINSAAQNDTVWSEKVIKPRVRVIIDNDFGGDPDGLFQLAHHLLSPSVSIKAIIGSPHYRNGFYGYPGNVDHAFDQANELLKVMKRSDRVSLYKASNDALTNLTTPVVSDGAKAIIKEAMREDTKEPLYVVCGAGLTTIASAYLIEPRIAKRLTLVWIGGAEYPDLAIAPPKAKNLEYNLGIDTKAGQVIFNSSEIPIWQIPRDAYRQALYSYAELAYQLNSTGETGKYLINRLEDLMIRSKRSLGEAYVLGDSPLVLLTALQTSWETDPASCKYVLKNRPMLNDKGAYIPNNAGQPIRVYTQIDTRLMLADLIAKLSLSGK